MTPRETLEWFKWECRIAAATLVLGVIAAALGHCDWRVLAVPVGVFILGEIMRDSLAIARHEARRQEREWDLKEREWDLKYAAKTEKEAQ